MPDREPLRDRVAREKHRACEAKRREHERLHGLLVRHPSDDLDHAPRKVKRGVVVAENRAEGRDLRHRCHALDDQCERIRAIGRVFEVVTDPTADMCEAVAHRHARRYVFIRKLQIGEVGA